MDTDTSKKLTERALGSVKWSALKGVVSRTASSLITLVLARLLTPEDFGVVAVATMIISFAQIFWEAGLGKALVRVETDVNDAASVVCWTNLFMGGLVYVGLFVFAPFISAFFHSPALVSVSRVLSIQVLISSLASVQHALFVRNFEFKTLFWVSLATAFMSGLLSIPLAFYGCGAWALVAGSLASSVLNVVLLWARSSWRPRLCYNPAIARQMLGFGTWVVGEALTGWFLVWGDSVLLGRFLGVEELGVYRVGWTVAMMIFGLVLYPFLPILYPAFSRLKGNTDALRAAFRMANRVVFSLTLPIGVGLFLTGPDLASLLFEDRWRGVGLAIGMLGLTQGLSWLVAINPELYRAMGSPDVNMKLSFVTVLCYLPVYLVAAPYGLKVFLHARLGVVFIGISLQVLYAVRRLKVSPLYLWKDGKPMILATAAMALVVIGLKEMLPSAAAAMPSLVQLAAVVMGGIVCYVLVLSWADETFVLQTKTLLRKAIVS